MRLSERGASNLIIVILCLTLVNSVYLGWHFFSYIPSRQEKDLEIAQSVERAAGIMDALAGSRIYNFELERIRGK